MDYGDITKITTTGASKETAKGDGRTQGGKDTSRDMALHDKSAMKDYKHIIMEVGKNLRVDPAVIAGIISRESRGGKGLDSKGEGDNGKAYGVMQVDYEAMRKKGKGVVKTGPKSKGHISQATEILIEHYEEIERRFSGWKSKDKWLKGALAAYNMGASNVPSYDRVDENTTHKDYSNDVVARAQYFKENGYGGS